jgi:hypothetical protein
MNFTPHEKALFADVQKGKRRVDDLPADLLEKLHEHYLPQMPYGTARGRDGDPYEFIELRLKKGELQ